MAHFAARLAFRLPARGIPLPTRLPLFARLPLARAFFPPEQHPIISLLIGSGRSTIAASAARR